MQVASLKVNFLEKNCFTSNRRSENIVFENSILSIDNSFVSSCLDSHVRQASVFNIGGFFLESSIDDKIKSVPIFLFCLQRWEARETYISCFYPENYPQLLAKFGEIDSEFKTKAFFLNWFDHESIVPNVPHYINDISNVFYYTERRFLDYRVFNSTASVDNKARRLTHLTCFNTRPPVKKRFVQKSRFYKRKFDWFLKNYA